MSAAETDIAPAAGKIAQDEEREREAFLRSFDPELALAEDLDDNAGLDVAIDHYLAAVVEREAEMERNREIADRRIAMIEAWLAEANASAEREVGWLRGTIAAFARQYDFGKKKSRALPHGTFGFRSQRDTLEIVDMTTAVAFAEAHELEIKKSVNKTPLLEHFAKTGEIPDGTEFVPGGESFFIKAGG